MYKKLVLLMVMVLLLFTIVSCGSSEDSAMDYNLATETSTNEMKSAPKADFGGMVEDAVEEIRDEEVEVSNQAVDQRKIIKSANMEVETLEFDIAVITLQNKVDAYGGYIESSNVSGSSIYDHRGTRNAYYALRIPSKRFSEFMLDINTIGNIISEGTYGNDITNQYYDTDARLKTLEVQEERLLDILRKAEKIEDIISLERELSNVRYEIESMAGSLRRWDNLVDYATLNISIYEVYEITEEVVHPKTLGERISIKFKNSVKDLIEFFEDLTVFSIGTIPFLVFWIPLLLIVIFIYKKIKKRLNRDFILPTNKEEKDKK